MRKSHLQIIHTTFDEIRHRRFDGMIITGAPVEQWNLRMLITGKKSLKLWIWSTVNVTSVLHICWGAQAALYHHFGIGKFELPKKCSGIYSHGITDLTVDLVRGFSDVFTAAPHSRHTSVSIDEVREHEDIKLLSYSEEAGPFIIQSKDTKHIMITGHLEYDAHTLADEYYRDVDKGDPVELPVNYFPNDDPTKEPKNTWRAHSHLLFYNWLNYYVYQETPYDWHYVEQIEYHI